jgi:transposase
MDGPAPGGSTYHRFRSSPIRLLKHLSGILNYCWVKVRFGVVEAINGNIRMLINCGLRLQ